MLGSNNSNNPLSARTAGVRVASEMQAGSSTGTPRTVIGVAKAEAVFVSFYDERGQESMALYFKVGDKYVAPRDTIEWCRRLHPAHDWIREGIERKFMQDQPVDLPKDDSVDVVTP